MAPSLLESARDAPLGPSLSALVPPLDLVAVVTVSDEPFERRALSWDLNGLPVPADLLVYTEDDWHRLRADCGRFARALQEETIWVFGI